jgi:hypothetical protein
MTSSSSSSPTTSPTTSLTHLVRRAASLAPTHQQRAAHQRHLMVWQQKHTQTIGQHSLHSRQQQGVRQPLSNQPQASSSSGSSRGCAVLRCSCWAVRNLVQLALMLQAIPWCAADTMAGA